MGFLRSGYLRSTVPRRRESAEAVQSSVPLLVAPWSIHTRVFGNACKPFSRRSDWMAVGLFQPFNQFAQGSDLAGDLGSGGTRFLIGIVPAGVDAVSDRALDVGG